MKKKETDASYSLVHGGGVYPGFYPVIMMVLVSLKDDVLLAKEPLSLKTSFAFENYRLAAEKMKYGRALFNSTVLTICSGLLTTFSGPAEPTPFCGQNGGRNFSLS